MRLRSLSATALAVAAAFQSAFAAPQAPAANVGDIKVVDWVQDVTYNSAPTSSATTTYTLTRTVMRVVQTTTTTDLTASSFATLASASPTLMPYTNGTMSVLGTGTTPSTTSSVMAPMRSEGAATRFGVEAAGVAAFAGLVGMLVA